MKKIEKIPKFDVVVGTPPPKAKKNFIFLNLAYQLSNRWIAWFHPSFLFIGDEYIRYQPFDLEKDKKRGDKSDALKKMFDGKIISMKFLNAAPIFQTTTSTPHIIDIIDKEKNDPKIEVIDTLNNNKKQTFDSIYQINKFRDQEIFPGLRDKYTKICEEIGDNLNQHINKKEGDYYVSFQNFGGSIDFSNTKNLYAPNFFTIVAKKEEVQKEPRGDNFFSFKTEKEAQNFLDFVKSKWARFGLAIRKVIQYNKGTLGYIPWLDWAESWPEDKFKELINATPEEESFVDKNIPKFY